MSQENVERFRDAVEEFRAGSEQSGWEGFFAKSAAILDPAVEWDATDVIVPDLRGVYRGKDAVERWWREWVAAWDTVESDYEMLDAGDRVVLLLDQRLRGRSTGIEVATGEYAQVATFKNGPITHWKLYRSHAEALEAAGLSE
jgi:SnoaL-like domain